MVDVKNARCEAGGCMKVPSFGMPGSRATRCSAHKEEGMVDVKHARCDMDGCTKQASVPANGKPNIFCVQHAVELGFHPGPWNDGASTAACDFFDALAAETGGRVSYNHARTKDSQGKPISEVSGLVEPHKNRPDGVRSFVKVADEPSVDFIASLEVCFYHGNYYHGWPPEDEGVSYLPKTCNEGASASSLHEKTSEVSPNTSLGICMFLCTARCAS